MSYVSVAVLDEMNLKQDEDSSASRRPPLAHHMSLPKSLSDIEQLLSDSIPCKIRAKRGCATHPRSIAERVNIISLTIYA